MKKGVRKLLTFLLVFSMIAGMGVSFAEVGQNYQATSDVLETFMDSSNSKTDVQLIWIDGDDLFLGILEDQKDIVSIQYEGIQVTLKTVDRYPVGSPITVEGRERLYRLNSSGNKDPNWVVVSFNLSDLVLEDPFTISIFTSAGGFDVKSESVDIVDGYIINYYIYGSDDKVPGISPNPVLGFAVPGTSVPVPTPNATEGYILMPNQDLSFTPTVNNSTKNVYYILNNYTITYTAETGGSISGTTPQTVASGGSTTEVTAVPDLGYHFVSWSDGDTSSTRSETNVTENATYTANFKANEVTPTYYTVTYAPGTQGTFSPKVTSKLLVGDPTPAAPATPGNSGHTFNGWSPTPSAKVTGNATYTAQWRANTPPPPPVVREYNLTIVYVYSYGDTAHEAYTDRLEAGQRYRVESPTIDDYTPNSRVVSGTMPDSSIRIVVTYYRDAEEVVTVTPKQPPLAPPPVVLPPVTVEVVPTEPLPQAPILPRTGTFGAGEMAGIGALLMAIGIMLKRKKDE